MVLNDKVRINDMINSKFNFLVSIAEDNKKSVSNTNNLDFEKAIKAYEDEFITGLTEEEKEKINSEIANYKSKNKLETKEDYEAFQNFVEGLLKRYGFKGDIEEMANSFMNSSNDTKDDNNSLNTNDIIKTYNQMKELNYRI